jgi:hypothetical protein
VRLDREPRPEEAVTVEYLLREVLVYPSGRWADWFEAASSGASDE